MQGVQHIVRNLTCWAASSRKRAPACYTSESHRARRCETRAKPRWDQWSGWHILNEGITDTGMPRMPRMGSACPRRSVQQRPTGAPNRGPAGPGRAGCWPRAAASKGGDTDTKACVGWVPVAPRAAWGLAATLTSRHRQQRWRPTDMAEAAGNKTRGK